MCVLSLFCSCDGVYLTCAIRAVSASTSSMRPPLSKAYILLRGTPPVGSQREQRSQATQTLINVLPPTYSLLVFSCFVFAYLMTCSTIATSLLFDANQSFGTNDRRKGEKQASSNSCILPSCVPPTPPSRTLPSVPAFKPPPPLKHPLLVSKMIVAHESALTTFSLPSSVNYWPPRALSVLAYGIQHLESFYRSFEGAHRDSGDL